MNYMIVTKNPALILKLSKWIYKSHSSRKPARGWCMYMVSFCCHI